MAGKSLLEDDEEDALSMVMGAPASDDGEEVDVVTTEDVPAGDKADPGRVLDEVQAKLEELRGLVASV